MNTKRIIAFLWTIHAMMEGKLHVRPVTSPLFCLHFTGHSVSTKFTRCRRRSCRPTNCVWNGRVATLRNWRKFRPAFGWLHHLKHRWSAARFTPSDGGLQTFRLSLGWQSLYQRLGALFLHKECKAALRRRPATKRRYFESNNINSTGFFIEI